ncbi:hypothetical protein RIF29_30629 [Crotalaria pallida]|uniref:Uncharacterized protein n=1 Tax=Crotalaria pallida TaxID=3830 RepID=A0AAN9ELJ3_CROPI
MALADTNNVNHLVLIISELLKEEERQHREVCVYRVPKALSSTKPEAFTPQFVGLGPYHHNRQDVIIKQKRKEAAAKRVLKDFFPSELEAFTSADKLVTELMELKIATDIRESYESGIAFEDDDSILYSAIVDALFLYNSLRGLVITEQDQSTNTVKKFELQDSILIGFHEMIPLVNAVGKEETKNAIIRDVFMLENQIPISVLKQIIRVINISHPDVNEDVGSKLLDFCRSFSPLVKIKQLSNKSEAVEHVHMLGLMYHLIVTAPKDADSDTSDPKPERPKYWPETMTNPWANPSPDSCFPLGCQLLLMFLFFIFQLSLVWISVILQIILFCIGMGLLFLVSLFIQGLLFLLVKPIFRLLGFLVGKLKYLAELCYPALEWISSIVNISGIPFPESLKKLVAQATKACQTCMEESTQETIHVTIPSVTELHQAGIHFQPAKGGVSAIDFKEKECNFCLPMIRVNVNSDVIIRNLMAYESLTKSDSLIFTRYIELMRAIIDTEEDVKLLVDEKIIQTELTHKEVADLFNGMSKSITPTNAKHLEDVIKKVNDKFDSTARQKLSKFVTKYVYPLRHFLAVFWALALVVLTAVQTYCSFYGCSASSKPTSGKMLDDGYGYRNNNYLTSSM